MSTDTLNTDRAEMVLTHLQAQEDDDSKFWATHLAAVLAAPRGGTLKAWMQSHHGADIDTYQVTMRSGEDDLWFITDFWTPGTRQVDAARATRVVLDGSEREYAGVRTVAMTETVYLGFAAWGNDMAQMVVYVR